MADRPLRDQLADRGLDVEEVIIGRTHGNPNIAHLPASETGTEIECAYDPPKARRVSLVQACNHRLCSRCTEEAEIRFTSEPFGTRDRLLELDPDAVGPDQEVQG